MGSNFEMEPIIPMRWTFDEGIRASCDAFSIAIPDGYRILESQDDNSEDNDITFSAVPKANEDNETSFRIAIRIAENLPEDAFEEHGIDELVIAMFRKALNDDENMFIPNSPEHWVAQGKNCPVLVTRIYSQLFGLFTRDSHLIRPISNDMSFRVEITMDEMNDEIAAAMHEPIDALVSSIEIKKPLESKLTERLNKISTQKVEPEELSETVNQLVTVATLCKQEENTANQLEYVRNCENPNSYELARAVVLGMEEFLDRIFPVLASVFDAIEFQKSLGTSQEELAGFAEAAKPILGLCITACNAEDQQSAQFLDEHGPVAFPEGFWNAVDYIDAYIPGTRIEMEEMVKAADDAFQAAIEKHINESPQDDQEPDGVDYPALVMTLLSDDWIFFEENEISWDGHHHAMAGAQLNEAKVGGLFDFVNSCIPGFDDVKEIFQYFASILNEVEKDEGLIVPREMIAPGVQKAIREGDLTGLTLANLAACGKALCVQKAKAGSYRVIFDSRLIIGIPSFLDLVARLIWDLRQCTNSMRGKPFEISFLQARNIDADHYLGSVEAPVPGAQKYAMFMKVTEAPRIALPSASEAAEYQEQVSIELSPEDDMALNFVYALVRDFPCTKPISGTHFLNRAARIEHIKAGDRLVLAADWNCEFFDPAGIEVFNEQGETLGYLEDVVGPMRGALALILPHVTATVESVTPLSKRKKGSKYALMDVHMELDDDATVEGILNVDPSSKLFVQTRSLLIRPKSERTVMSHANIDISQLKGRIDVSNYAYGDTAGPAGDNDPIIHLDQKPNTTDASSANGSCITPKTASGVRSHDELSLANDEQAEQNAHEQAERKRIENEARAKAESERAERERAEQERLKAEEKARIEHAAHISRIKSRVSMHRAAIAKAKLDVEIKRRALSSMRKDDSIPRPRVRATQYQVYTLELMIDQEATGLNKLLLGLSEDDAHEAEVDTYMQDAFEGPLLPTAIQAIERHRVFCSKIAEGKNGDKREPFNDPLYGRILEHLIETGGGLGPGAIRHDAETTKIPSGPPSANRQTSI